MVKATDSDIQRNTSTTLKKNLTNKIQRMESGVTKFLEDMVMLKATDSDIQRNTSTTNKVRHIIT